MNDKSISNNKDVQTVMIETVFPSMVNQYGTLFGGIALQWMDKSAWVCATRFARCTMVTVASDRVEFKKPAPLGSLVELTSRIIRVGNTSVTVEVQLITENPLSGEQHLATSGEFVMVALDKEGKPCAIGKCKE